jgi:CheY-like chemotaxis protein
MGKVVLIIEDDPKSLKLFQALLQAEGHVTLEATDGKQGVGIAKVKKPDLILMDIQLPVMDGVKAARILKADQATKDIPIMALTAYAMKGDKERICEAGCDGCITKPVDTREFLKKIAEYLSR